MIAALVAPPLLGRAAPADTPDPGYRFAPLARARRRRGPPARPPRSARTPASRRRFRAAGLRVGGDAFRVPGHGRSRNVVGVWDAPASCLVVLLAHTDSIPPAPGADDNASGVGTLVALAPRLEAIKPRCDVWLIATGAEERIYTGRPDHLGALAAVARVRRLGRAPDLRFALSLDEVGRGRAMLLRSPVAAQRASVERPILAAGRGTGLRVGWERDGGTGNSDHREFELAGLPGAKLGVPDDSCRHTACDRQPPGRGHVPARAHASSGCSGCRARVRAMPLPASARPDPPARRRPAPPRARASRGVGDGTDRSSRVRRREIAAGSSPAARAARAGLDRTDPRARRRSATPPASAGWGMRPAHARRSHPRLT